MSKALERIFDNKRLSPFRDFSQLEDSFDKLFREFMDIKKSNGLKEWNFTPSCEVSESGNSYQLKFDLPGVSKDQVRVEVDKDQLTVSAERKEEKKQQDKKTYMSEIYYGAFSRSFSLPGPVEEKNVDAKFENGVLTITVPKIKSEQSKQIPIQ